MNGIFVHFSKSTFRKHTHTDRYSDLIKPFIVDFRVGGDESTTADIMRDAASPMTKKTAHYWNEHGLTECSFAFCEIHCSNDPNDSQILEMDSESVTDMSDSENITNNVPNVERKRGVKRGTKRGAYKRTG